MNPNDRNDRRRESLKRRVMRRVYAIAAFRLLAHPITTKTAMVTALFWKSTTVVSYAHVFSNLPNTLDLGRHLVFFRRAVVATDGFTMLVVTMMVMVALWLILDIFRYRERTYS